MTCIRGCFFFFLLMSFTSIQTADIPNTCVNIQDKETIDVHFHIPSFLTNADKAKCQVYKADRGYLRCGQTDVYIKPECVCSFHNVYEAVYHGYSSCPPRNAPDLVTKLNCPVCKKYSLNNTGPCINGGKLTCRGEEEATEVTCQCPPNYEGRLCENKIENVTRICDRILITSTNGLPDCALTGRDCITYSRNKLYAYKCNETHVSQNREDLPLCIDTEDFASTTTSEEVSYSSSSIGTKVDDNSLACIGASLPGVIWTILMSLSFFFKHL